MSEDAIFAKASQLTGEAREEWLREACGDDRGLRRRIDKLLAAHDNPDSYLELKYSEDDIPAALKKLEACQITRRHGTNAHWARAFQTRWAEFVATRAEENTGDGIDFK